MSERKEWFDIAPAFTQFTASATGCPKIAKCGVTTAGRTRIVDSSGWAVGISMLGKEIWNV